MVVALRKDSGSCCGTEVQKIRPGIVQGSLHSYPGEAPTENGLNIMPVSFIKCIGTL